jgi:uncharacterized membrane protein YGL010W
MVLLGQHWRQPQVSGYTDHHHDGKHILLHKLCAVEHNTTYRAAGVAVLLNRGQLLQQAREGMRLVVTCMASRGASVVLCRLRMLPRFCTR